jgi:hypothetical protein
MEAFSFRCACATCVSVSVVIVDAYHHQPIQIPVRSSEWATGGAGFTTRFPTATLPLHPLVWHSPEERSCHDPHVRHAHVPLL